MLYTAQERRCSRQHRRVFDANIVDLTDLFPAEATERSSNLASFALPFPRAEDATNT